MKNVLICRVDYPPIESKRLQVSQVKLSSILWANIGSGLAQDCRKDIFFCHGLAGAEN